MKKYTFLLLFLVLSSMIFVAIILDSNEKDGLLQTSEQSGRKKVVLIIIDSMTSELLHKGFADNDFPALKFLASNGRLYEDLVAAFPSMSVTIESTILTGEMPDAHKIPGLTWYSAEKDRLVDYGTSFEVMRKRGVQNVLADTLHNLNNEHLSKDVTTVFENLQQQGVSTGSVNTLVYRGSADHELKVPYPISKFTNSPRSYKTKGPDVLAFGKLSAPELDKNLPDSIFQKFGITDHYSAEVVKALIKQQRLPDFSMVYFPDFDKEAHKNGPLYKEGLQKADNYLGEILSASGSWEKAMKDYIFIVIGDHGQTETVKDKDELTIDLERLYKKYTIAPFGGKVSKGDIAFGNNHRMTYVYSVKNHDPLSELAETGIKDKRIAFGAWVENGWVNVISPDEQGVFRYKAGGEWKDEYAQSWSLEGNPDILSLQVKPQGTIGYGDYPDVLNQLESALHSHDEPVLILTAKPGYSFFSETAPIHPDGGEHGGIHKDDTLAAMIITGTDKEPRFRRMVDLKEYILSLFAE
ncbi:alkaline phosphatase family protein [Pseudalkalibacillus salsuginis]|uniref:alkaline phosphatase family protein n=1 Tax=Pseudalkalibacillus salsuginis TaxID=2910972 RepID=UPI001F352296|nr:alkaline phosphatase family protein [Pseudalkalibacillus salsuginis]MCF6409455.1 alkaline phosphatase family protein [Pseudalkalibacillus salsuginis]